MKRQWPEQETWVMRQLGAAFDPDTMCEYTGRALHKFPCGVGYMGYWMACGTLRACRQLTPEESAWIVANPVPYQQQQAAFRTWLLSTRKS